MAIKGQYKEEVIKEFPRLGFNDSLKVRLIKPEGKSRIVLDIRQFIESEKFTGFTRRGIRLDFHDLGALEAIIPEIREMMEKK